MAVSAQSDKVLSFPAKAAEVDMRSGGRLSAGSYAYEGDELITTWHAHDLHQLEYAFHGTVEVETTTAHFLLPPQQAAWIPSGVEHRTTIRTAVRTISVFFESDLVPDAGGRVRILAVPPVLREMMIYSGRSPIGRRASDDVADVYFVALGRLVSEALDSEAPLFLPTSSDPVLAAALTWTRENLDTARMGEVARSRRPLRALTPPTLRGGAGHVVAELRDAGSPARRHGPPGRVRTFGPPSGERRGVREPELVQSGLSREDRNDALGLPQAAGAAAVKWRAAPGAEDGRPTGLSVRTA